VREATTWDGHYAEKRRAPSNNRTNGAEPQPLRLSQSSKVRLSFELRVIHSARTVIDNETDDFFAKHQSSSLWVNSRSAAAGLRARGELSHHSSTSGGELRAEAFKAQPPREQGTFLKPNLLELVKLDPTIKLDIRYATSNNFLGAPVYTQARAFLQRPAAEALLRAHRELKAQGYGLIIHDGYRPWYVTKIFWDATPADKRIFVADPAEGSRHNRGCAVDLSLYDLKTGEEVKMPSGYDEMSNRSFADYVGGTADERARRALLRQAMEKQGFTVYPQEWWHFDYKDWKQYPILNVKFEDLGQ
jgi:zinc D-Ala-D-Ala dipeptidase